MRRRYQSHLVARRGSKAKSDLGRKGRHRTPLGRRCEAVVLMAALLSSWSLQIPPIFSSYEASVPAMHMSGPLSCPYM